VKINALIMPIYSIFQYHELTSSLWYRYDICRIDIWISCQSGGQTIV